MWKRKLLSIIFGLFYLSCALWCRVALAGVDVGGEIKRATRAYLEGKYVEALQTGVASLTAGHYARDIYLLTAISFFRLGDYFMAASTIDDAVSRGVKDENIFFLGAQISYVGRNYNGTYFFLKQYESKWYGRKAPFIE